MLAQEQDIHAAVDYKIHKMQTELHLTEAQAYAIRPIIKDYLTQRQAALQPSADRFRNSFEPPAAWT